MIKYPNGKTYNKQTKISNNKQRSLTAANRGMRLENNINIALEYYRNNNIALIYKRPTPINVVKVDYSDGARIIDAYFEKQSTTDYNGIYKGKYIDFEAKNTKSKSSFPLNNIYLHQINHLQKVIEFGGIAFFIIDFESYDEIYLLDAKYIIDFYLTNERKSIPYDKVKENGLLIKQGFNPRLYLIDVIDKKYFKETNS